MPPRHKSMCRGGFSKHYHMKPKTPYQRRIVELNKSVGALSDIIIEWARENAITHPAVRRKNNVTVCSMCGNAMVYAGNSRMVKCMECGRTLRVIETDTWKSIKGTLKGWFSTLGVIDGLQVQRTFEIRCRYLLKGQEHQYFIRELCRHWLSPDGTPAITALPRLMGQFMDSFPFNGKIELRGSSQMVYDYIADNAEVYPDYKLIPLLSESLTIEDILGYGRQTTLQKALQAANNR